MTTEHETQHIHALLPLLVTQSWGYSFYEQYQEEHPEIADSEALLLMAHLVQEDLAIEHPKTGNLITTPKGAAIARESGGYLGHLSAESKRKKTEEQRARGNFIGTFGSFIVAGLALLFALYTYFSAAHDSQALEKQVDALTKRVQLLEIKPKHDQHPQRN